MTRFILAISILSLLFTSCSGGESGESGEENEGNIEETSIISPPLSGDFQNDTTFIIDPTKETVVSTPNGSSIEIPANIIVDEKGKPVKKKVELKFTQYHSPAEILASGIPMTYDSAGTSGTFASAGMFSLDARTKKKGKKVFIKEGASAKVNLASDMPGNNYNFYQLNEQNGDWTYEMNPREPVRRNPRFDATKYPMKPKKADKNAFVLDLDFDKSDYSELSLFNGIVWEYVGDHDSLDPRKNDKVGKIQWSKFDLEPTNENAYEYYLTMHQSQYNFTTKVRAALQGSDFDAAMKQFKDKKVEVASQMSRIQKPYVRPVSISGFATYNYDYIHLMAVPQSIIADFDFGKNNKDKDQSIVFVVYEDDAAVANYPKGDWEKFAIDREQSCKIFAVTPNNTLSAYTENLNKCFGKKEYTFKMKAIAENLDSKADLEKLITEL